MRPYSGETIASFLSGPFPSMCFRAGSVLLLALDRRPEAGAGRHTRIGGKANGRAVDRRARGLRESAFGAPATDAGR